VFFPVSSQPVSSAPKSDPIPIIIPDTDDVNDPVNHTNNNNNNCNDPNIHMKNVISQQTVGISSFRNAATNEVPRKSFPMVTAPPHTTCLPPSTNFVTSPNSTSFCGHSLLRPFSTQSTTAFTSNSNFSTMTSEFKSNIDTSPSDVKSDDLMVIDPFIMPSSASPSTTKEISSSSGTSPPLTTISNVPLQSSTGTMFSPLSFASRLQKNVSSSSVVSSPFRVPVTTSSPPSTLPRYHSSHPLFSSPFNNVAQWTSLSASSAQDDPISMNKLNALSNSSPQEVVSLVAKILQGQQNLNEEVPTPPEMTVELFKHQRQGLAWMIKRETSGIPRGGIVADHMGLGKTIQMIACILASRSKTKFTELEPKKKSSELQQTSPRQTTLIICPLSCIMQWQKELTTKVAPSHLKVAIHHGQSRFRMPQQFSDYDVVLTTYATVASEFPKNAGDPSGPTHTMKWYRVVLDEAHCIKNRNTRQAKACYMLRAKYRWCMTGTPIQNGLDDLFSLLHFLNYSPYSDYNYWKRHIIPKLYQKGFSFLQTILSPVLLCRTKDMTIDGRPLLELPKRNVTCLNIKFSPQEEDFYQALYTKSKTKFDSYLQKGTVVQNYTHILVLLLRLRQACDHPFLATRGRIKAKLQTNNNNQNGVVNNDEKKTIESSNNDTDDRMEECTLCPICLDEIEEVVSTPCHHVFCRSCIMKYITQSLEQRQQQPQYGVVIFGPNDDIRQTPCPVCRTPLNENDLIGVEDSSLGEVTVVPGLAIESSTKIKSLLEQLEKMKTNDPEAKAIIFSQWTTMLNLIENPLKENGWSFTRLDGSMTLQKRRQQLEEFKTHPEVRLLLMSLKAGGLGLNLIDANYVFMLDPWWNPAVEDQAIDRVHRLGQTKPVNIFRFIIKGTVEERILELQEKKKKLAEGVLNKNQIFTRLNVDDLVQLFSS
jgi:SNF2 family DNA or RNA helicase